LYDGKLYVFSSKRNRQTYSNDIQYVYDCEIGKIVQASCCYPGIFSPCKYNDELLVDGGIAENLPWRETKKAGADKVLSIVFSDKIPKSCCNNIYEILNKSFSILCHELSKYEWDGTDYLLEIKEPKTGLLEKSKMNLLYNEGYNQTKEQIRKIRQKLLLNMS